MPAFIGQELTQIICVPTLPMKLITRTAATDLPILHESSEMCNPWLGHRGVLP